MPNIALIVDNILSDSGVPITYSTSGTSGTSGANGSSGTAGTSGSSGSSGTSATSGSSGTSGTKGTSGTSATSGSSGTSATSGSSGTSGLQGTSGTSGTNGSSGTSGTKGTSGTSGANGSSGTSGANGAAGSSGTSGASPTLSGTTNYLPKFTGTSTIGNSLVYDNGTNVGIGTTSPATILHVAQDNGAITLTRASGGYGTKIVQSNSDGSINFQIGLATAGAWSTYMRLGEGESTPPLMLQPYGNNVLIGTTTNSTYKLDVNGTARFSGDVTMTSAGSTTITNSGTIPILNMIRNNNASSPAAQINFKTSQGTTRWQIATNSATGTGFEINEGDGVNNRFYIAPTTGAATFSSSVTALSFFESSDSRLKTLIQDNYRALGIETIKPKLYIKDGREEVGYFAQDVKDILSTAVSINDAGFLSLSYTQVHTAKIAIIEDEVDVLKKEVAELKVKLQKYEA